MYIIVILFIIKMLNIRLYWPLSDVAVIAWTLQYLSRKKNVKNRKFEQFIFYISHFRLLVEVQFFSQGISDLYNNSTFLSVVHNQNA